MYLLSTVNPPHGYSYRLVPGDHTLPMLVFIHGYCQTGQETWDETIARLQRDGVINPMLIIERAHGNHAGRHTIEDQLQAMRDYVASLRKANIIGRRVIWIGHSFGSVIADDLTYTFSSMTEGVIPITPVSTNGYWIFFNPWFWLRGGFISLWAVAVSIVTGRSVRFPSGMARGLFAGPLCSVERFNRFLAVQQPDSALMFVQALFAYFLLPSHLAQLRTLGQDNRRVMIGCTQDPLILPWSLRWFAWRTDTPLHWVDSGHCWWLSGGIDAMAAELKTAITQLSG